MTETVTVSSSELSAMRAELRNLRGTVATLATIIHKMVHSPAAIRQNKDEEHRSLTDAEREYRIDRQELQALLGVSERTAYRRIKEYGFRVLQTNVMIIVLTILESLFRFYIPILMAVW